MFDFLLKNSASLANLKEFIALVIRATVDEVLVFKDEDFYEKADVLDLSSCSCLCLFSYVQGDAEVFLQIFRCALEAAELKERVISVSASLGVECYVPDPVSNAWICVANNGVLSDVVMVDSESEGCFYFV